jgi:plastocyanin
MTRRAMAAPTALALAVALATAFAFVLVPSRAMAASVPVTIQYQSYRAGSIDALPGDAVTWTNDGGRTHTVTADYGAFDSGDLSIGHQFTWTPTAPGTYTYHCAIHTAMLGVVHVRLVTLAPLPTGPVAAGQTVQLQGRTADPTAPVTIERDTGHGFEPIATVTPRADGTWQSDVAATATAHYRATVPGGVSETRRVLAIDRRVHVRLANGYLFVHVVPRAPDARVALDLYLRDRFGWWPTRRTRLNSESRARFAIRAPVRARVALLGQDGWTALATSRTVRMRRQ